MVYIVSPWLQNLLDAKSFLDNHDRAISENETVLLYVSAYPIKYNLGKICCCFFTLFKNKKKLLKQNTLEIR